jgi:hypothetical protein
MEILGFAQDDGLKKSREPAQPGPAPPPMALGNRHRYKRGQ